MGPISAPRAASSPSVMVVDDNDELRHTVTRLLQGAGYQVRFARNGRDALEQLEHAAAPDLIVLDLVMPQMDGWEFRLEQRKRPKLAEVPVVVLSADRSSKARAMDADVYLSKPLDAKRLLLAVEAKLLAAERRKLDHRTAELDRLGSLGVLASGIAHEINNPLAVTVGSVDLGIQLLREARDGGGPLSSTTLARVLSLLDDARAGTQRIANVVRAVGTFSHPHDNRVGVVDLRDVVESSIRLVANELRHRAQLSCELDAELFVLGNAAQLGQVFINLLTNAARAIEEGNALDHSIRVAGWRRGEASVVIEVSDTGSGIAPENLSRVFDPFFTTRAVGEGMGLGLAVSQRLVAAAGGSISVRSTLGEGATFRVELPYHAVEDAERAPSASPAASVMPSAATHRPRVMVVDDEPMMCELLRHMLEPQHKVTTFSKPRAALEALRSDPHWDVVLSDVMMPELSGMELFEAAVGAHPALAERFLFMSGGTFTARAQAFLQARPQKALLKPFPLEELERRIHAILAGG